MNNNGGQAFGPTPDLRRTSSASFRQTLCELDGARPEGSRFGAGTSIETWTWARLSQQYNAEQIHRFLQLIAAALMRLPSTELPEGDYRSLVCQPTAGHRADRRNQPLPDVRRFTATTRNHMIALANWSRAADDISTINGINDAIICVLQQILPDFVINQLSDPHTGLETVTPWHALEVALNNATPISAQDASAKINDIKVPHDYSSVAQTLCASFGKVNLALHDAETLKLPFSHGLLILHYCCEFQALSSADDPRGHLTKFSERWCRVDHALGTEDWNAFDETTWKDFQQLAAEADRKRIEHLRSSGSASRYSFSTPTAANAATDEIAQFARLLLSGQDESETPDDDASLAPSLATTNTAASSAASGHVNLSEYEAAMEAIVDRQLERLKAGASKIGTKDTDRRYSRFEPRTLTQEQQPCKNRRRLGIAWACPCKGSADPAKGCDAANKFKGTRPRIVQAALEYEATNKKA